MDSHGFSQSDCSNEKLSESHLVKKLLGLRMVHQPPCLFNDTPFLSRMEIHAQFWYEKMRQGWREGRNILLLGIHSERTGQLAGALTSHHEAGRLSKGAVGTVPPLCSLPRVQPFQPACWDSGRVGAVNVLRTSPQLFAGSR